ncbi:MAG: AAA family ATPase, partial [Leptolyngbya sp. SIO4C1]|nr:AAA family ATPase [Leptolyngbya sp. SIO4C1]
MNVMICKSLFPSLAQLSGTEIKRANDFIIKFQNDPSQPGLSMERVTKTKNDNLWSARITQDLRAIIYKDGDTWALLHAGHHDDAYAWAKKRKVEFNERTGALQIVEFTESVGQVLPERQTDQMGLFDKHADDYLLSLGVPPLWLPILRKLITEDDFLSIVEKLPEEVQERLLQVVAGELVTPPTIKSTRSLIDNVDTQRRFISVKSQGELEKMLQAPLATWIGFLHPSQKRLVTGNFNGPVKVTGSAGTGKTIVALHRARHLARQGKQVLLTTFVSTLCDNLTRSLQLLCTPEELGHITIATVASQAGSILSKAKQGYRTVNDDEIKHLIDIHGSPTCLLDSASLWQEWRSVIQPHGISTWEEYRSVSRIGRGQALTIRDRKKVWQVFESIFSQLHSQHKVDWGVYFRRATDILDTGTVQSPYDAVIVDEVQDLKPQALKFLNALAGASPNSFMMVGDGGQQIYQGRFSLKSLGINVQGRSHILKINYRTTEQICRFADRITDPESDDLDGNREPRKGTVSLLQGPEPILQSFENPQSETAFVNEKIQQLLERGLLPNEIGIFARTRTLLHPIQKVLKKAKIPWTLLEEQDIKSSAAIQLGTMHRAKGLEFKAVFAIQISDKVLPLPQALTEAYDIQAKEEALERERHLLYVTITRAR